MMRTSIWNMGWSGAWAAAMWISVAACGGGRPGGGGDAAVSEAVMDAGADAVAEGGSDAADADLDGGPECGNGVVEGDEECDDGNFQNGDGCSVTCLDEPASCGDGTCDMDGGETCLNCVPDCRMHPDCNMCPDEDGDGYRDARCGGDDCSDSNPDIHPGAMEVPCNRRDDDCDPSTADVVDADGDGAGCDIDCDDSDPMRSPLLSEVCGNTIDDDCNEATADSGDSDGDGYDCSVDCDETDPDIHPGADEVCGNFVDDDCDPSTPDVFDADGDGATCDEDCDDSDPDVRPGRRGGEICNDGKDNDCDPSTPDLFDADRDGSTCEVDCDDSDPDRAPSLREICGNMIDDDCNAATADSGDSDGDGYDCSVDCDDGDATVFPDASGRCGPGFTQRWTFESGPEGWTSGGTNSSWDHGTPSGMDIASCGEGSRCWVTNLSGEYNDDEDSWIESPPMDLSAIRQDPMLTFRQAFVTERCCDEFWVEVSVDGGTSWRKVGEEGTGVNWYNSPSDYWNDRSSDERPLQWRPAAHILTGVAGRPDVRLRIHFSSDFSVRREGIGIDDVEVSNERVDLAVQSVSVSGVQCAGDRGRVSVTVQNLGAVRVPGYTVSYRIGTGAWVDEVVSRPLEPGGTAVHSFPNRPTFAMGGDVALSARVVLMGDSVPGNDQLDTTLTVSPFLTFDGSTRYDATFESGGEGWAAGGVNSSWQHGTPIASMDVRTITSCAEGTSCWVTNLTGDYNKNEESHLYSPCFDMSMAGADPFLEFQQIIAMGSGDGVWVEVSYDRGLTWTKLGSSTSGGINWYDDATDQRWEADSSGWRQAGHPLLGSAGQGWVRFRFVLKSGSFGEDEGVGIDQLALIP